MYNKYSRRKTIFLARREERNSISRREVTVKNRSVTSRLDFQTVAVIRQSPEWTKVNEARSTPAIIQTPVLLSDRSIWKAENRSRRTNLSSLKTVISRCKRYIRECKTWKTPRAVISIVFRGKTRGWENSRVEAERPKFREEIHRWECIVLRIIIACLPFTYNITYGEFFLPWFFPCIFFVKECCFHFETMIDDLCKFPINIA